MITHALSTRKSSVSQVSRRESIDTLVHADGEFVAYAIRSDNANGKAAVLKGLHIVKAVNERKKNETRYSHKSLRLQSKVNVNYPNLLIGAQAANVFETALGV